MSRTQPPVPRLVVTGSESTGKTTLVERLAAHFALPFASEFVRDYAQRKASPIDASDHWPIAAGQIARHDAVLLQAATSGAPLVLFDTDLLSHVTYCHHYTGGCEAGIEQLARERLAAHYLLLDIDVPWVNDGLRDRGDRRAELHTEFLATLHRFAAPFTIIGGSWQERFAQAAAVTARWLPVSR
jgi:NadR type nicotinamide-nucleotide adenylyltransferase